MGKYQRLALLAFVLTAFSMALFKASAWHVSYGFRMPPAPEVKAPEKTVVVRRETVRKKGRRQSQRVMETIVSTGHIDSYFASSRFNTQTHAASLVELKDGRTRAFWFSGSREGASDVTISSAVFDPAKNVWSDEQTVIGRGDTQRGLH
ncbi:MAG: exo-alpha-sialidase, partial [Gallionella sp.]|nr:exo-alpha-sialidase [Gallionella sp.]